MTILRLIGIGDSVVDYYQDQGKMYPGGNALNVAVFTKRCGAERAAYLGIVGQDKAGSHVINSLGHEGIEIARVRLVQAPTGVATVSIKEDGDRVFVTSNKLTRAQSMLALKLNPDDIEYIQQFDVIHTSINSDIEHELQKIAHRPISFDFSTHNRWDREYLGRVCPSLTYAFFSGSEMSLSEINDLIDYVHKLGVQVIGVTRGAQPAIFSENKRVYQQNPKPIKVVDTMGAGDSFIGAFLTHYYQTEDIHVSLDRAASFASEVCQYYGAFGYGADVTG